MRNRYIVNLGLSILIATGLQSGRAVVAQRPAATQEAQGPSAVGGGASTRLADGRWLLVGGQDSGGPVATAWIYDPATQTSTALPSRMNQARTGHTATLLPDGTVLLLGGRNASALIEVPEIFDPTNGTFTLMPVVGAAPRTSHTATLLTDGRVLVAGGDNGGSSPLPTELWDPNSQTVTTVGEDGVDRSGHRATLMADGRVLVSDGITLDGMPPTDAVAIESLRGTLQRLRPPSRDAQVPTVRGSIPTSGAVDVPLDAHFAVRFSDPLSAESLTPEAFRLSGPDGPVATRVVVAEDGRLAFVWPAETLSEGESYTLAVSGALDRSGVSIAPASIRFTTVRSTPDRSDLGDNEEWVPDAESVRNGWRTNRPRSGWESLAPLMAPPGVTAISGRVLTLDGRPLADVTLEEGDANTHTDRTGRFLLVLNTTVSGRRVMEIEGKTASRPGRQYGFFEYGMTPILGQTNVLPFTIWMPKLDTRHVVTIPSPTTREVVVTTPSIPGLELHIPPQTVIRGEDGKPVTRVGITAIPVDRPPFPLAKNVDVPVYFTIQPGGSYVYTAGARPKGAWLVYPNYREQAAPGRQVQFFNYDPDEKDWHVYGLGRVNRDGTQVVPDPTTRIYEFTGAMINVPGLAPFLKWLTSPWRGKGDPVDPSTGLFSTSKTDLYLPDVIPLALTRTYNSGDGQARPFGFGMMHSYAMFLWSANEYQEADLILPEGERVHYVRTSAGVGFINAVFEHTTTPTRFYKSTIAFNGNGWDLTLQDGTVYVFGDNAPLQAIKDRYGNTVTITHASGQSGNITRVTSPNGRYIAFTYDTSNRVTQAADNIGRTVGYTYDTSGNLSTVTDPENAVTTYTYDTSHQLLTIRDGRNTVYLTNQYDTNGRVSQQTLADTSATYQFSYTVSSGSVTQTDITDPRGHVERLVFNSDHYITSETQAYGTSLARTTTTTRQTGTNLVTAVVDGLSRRTEYTYDSTGHVLTTTRLAGTSGAVTTTFTYEPTFFQLATVTDPLSHVWTIGYDASAKPTTITDPLSHVITLAMNTAGQLTSLTDALSHSWQFGYFGGDLISVTDPLSAVRSLFIDAAGRVVSTTDPLGRISTTTFDKLNRPTAVVDPAGGQTSFSYDANSNLLSLSDALTHATTYTFDTSDRVATGTDPLTHSSSYQHDLNGNLTQVTDRKSQVTGSNYDALDRITQVTFHDASTIAYTYDAGDRITQIVDSINGTITRTYDGLDRLTQETTPQGTVDYTYDAAGRRATMTVAGQTAVSYTYDNANRLTVITQGSASVAITYDNADRRSTLTFPNGILATYSYDNANRLTSLAYTLSGGPVGDLTYSYDLAGNRTSIGGSWARTGLPSAVTSASYDAANRMTAWGSASLTYDLNGNLTGDGSTTYTWNTRDQLTGLSGGASASFTYDGVGRRRGKVISSTTTNLLYDGINLVQELNSGGTPTANLLTGLGIDETFTRTVTAGTSTLLVDALGSTFALANASGTVQTTYTYDPFGATSMSGTTSTNAAQFTGRENDGTGLYFSRARYYSPGLQRFISEDPLGPEGGINLFAYVGNRPTTFIDPLGLKQSPCFGPCPDGGDGRDGGDGPDTGGKPANNGKPGGPGKPGNSGAPGNRCGSDRACLFASDIGYIAASVGNGKALVAFTGAAAVLSATPITVTGGGLAVAGRAAQAAASNATNVVLTHPVESMTIAGDALQAVLPTGPPTLSVGGAVGWVLNPWVP